MGSCSNCGAGVPENTRFCSTCGTATTNSLVPLHNGGQTIEVQSPPPALWYVTYATGQRGGPFTENDIHGMIARQELKVTDAIVAQGGNTWVPITQSPFASLYRSSSQHKSPRREYLPSMRERNDRSSPKVRRIQGAFHNRHVDYLAIWIWNHFYHPRLHRWP